MFKSKKADLEAQQDNSYAYSTAPPHHLTSITASAVHFLEDNTSQTQSPTQPANVAIPNTHGQDALVQGLCLELNAYLCEPRMDLFKVTNEGSVMVCDPLLYWTVCMFPTSVIIPHLFA